jgi:PKD repeat protein
VRTAVADGGGDMNALSKKPAKKPIGVLSLALLSLLAGSLAKAQPAHVQLPANARGAAAIAALGEHLPEVAKAYGLENHVLAHLLQTQPSLGVDRQGALCVVCEGLGVKESPARGQGRKGQVEEAITPDSSTTALIAGTPVDALKLHSMPGASRVIYLDFDGHTTSGTSWNSSFNSGNAIVSQPFDLDGSPTTFNDAERAVILGIWKRVAEDYAPFAIDVTTEDPGLEALRKSSSSDATFGTRVVISPSNWYNGSAGGVAYIGSFNWNTDTPCFVFTAQLANAEKYIAEAISHEVGHTVGLYHDGASGTEYYTGHGNWAPIMGVGYYKNITQFSKGDYAGASNTQDDLATIAGYAPLATDDHGNTLATATPLAGPAVGDGGTIESRTDVDLFRFETGAGAVSLAIRSSSAEPNLDVSAELLNASGQVLQTSNPAGLDAAISATLSAGSYYLRIRGVGAGDPLTTGYPDYGSIGNYVITGTLVTPAGKQAPIARASASTTSGTGPLTVTFNGSGSSDADGTIVGYHWTFGTGDSSATMNPTYTYNAAGTYSVYLTVTDNDGLVGTTRIDIAVTAPANQAPVAATTSNVSSGMAPLPVTFSSAGSFDPDGTLAAYRWEFGDGTTSTSASPAKTYSAAGNYTVRLTVTDNLGASASATQQITVSEDTGSDVDIRQFSLAAVSGPGGNDSARATIVVQDRAGRPVSGVTVALQWSGLVSGSSTGKTDANGQVILTSKASKKAGTIKATVSGVTPPIGRAYDPAIYTEPTIRSVTLP